MGQHDWISVKLSAIQPELICTSDYSEGNRNLTKHPVSRKGKQDNRIP